MKKEEINEMKKGGMKKYEEKGKFEKKEHGSKMKALKKMCK